MDFCDKYLQIENSREILSQLETNRLFTFVLDEERECYCYHDLYQEFLYKKLQREFDDNFVNRIQMKAANLYKKEGNIEESLGLFLSAKEYDRACILYEKSINGWLQQGRFYRIGFFADRIPNRYLEKYPGYLRIEGYLAAATFDNRLAQKKIKTYLKHNRQISNENTRNVLFFLAVLYFELGDYLQAESEFKKLWVQKELTGPIRYDLRKFQAYVAVSLKKTKEADTYLNEYQAYIENQDMEQGKKEVLIFDAQCRRHFIVDDYTKAVLFGKKAIRQSKETKLEQKDNIRNCYVFVSNSLFQMGRFAEGLEIAEKGLSWIEEAGIKDIMQPEVFLYSISANIIGLGRIEEGIVLAEKGLRHFTKKEFYIYQARHHWILSEAYFLTGNLTLAEDHVKKAFQIIPDQHPRRCYYEIYLNHMNIELGKYDDVQTFLTVNKNQDISSAEKCEYSLLQAHYYSAVGKRNMAIRRFQEALLIMEERDIYLGLIAARTWAASMLVETYAQGKMATYIQKTMIQPAGDWRKKGLLSCLSVKDPKIKKTVLKLVEHLPKAPTTSLTISFFGKFSVRKGDDELPDEQWKSRQAKMLFKFLVFKSTKGYTEKEILMDLLWPDERSQTASKRFHVILALLRKILEPDLQPGVSSSYISREGDGYRLFLGEKGLTDVEEFWLALKKGRESDSPAVAQDYFKKAESIYKGDFLEEDPYEEWCSPEREWLKKEYLNILIWLMDYYETDNDHKTGIFHAEKYLTIDPYEEGVYRRLMAYHLKNDTPEKVNRVFERCVKHLNDGLDSPISPKTEQLYQQILTQHLK